VSWRIWAVAGVLVVSGILGLMAHPGLAEFNSESERRSSLRGIQLAFGQIPLAVGLLVGDRLARPQPAGSGQRRASSQSIGLIALLLIVAFSGRGVPDALRVLVWLLGAALYLVPVREACAPTSRLGWLLVRSLIVGFVMLVGLQFD
jgi:hypothetical protein